MIQCIIQFLEGHTHTQHLCKNTHTHLRIQEKACNEEAIWTSTRAMAKNRYRYVSSCECNPSHLIVPIFKALGISLYSVTSLFLIFKLHLVIESCWLVNQAVR